jgi:hypothetical protein
MKPLATAHVRLRNKLCETCPTQCAAHVSAKLAIADRDSVCELNRWPKISTVGLGDVVAFIAEPMARAIDKVARTKLAGCAGCNKRRQFLNRL